MRMLAGPKRAPRRLWPKRSAQYEGTAACCCTPAYMKACVPAPIYKECAAARLVPGWLSWRKWLRVSRTALNFSVHHKQTVAPTAYIWDATLSLHQCDIVKQRHTLSTSSSLTSTGRSASKDAMPTSSHAFRLLLTYVSESPRLPTRTTARPGTCKLVQPSQYIE